MTGTMAIFVRGLRGGGAQRAMIRFASGLVNRGIAVDLLTLHPDGPFRAELDSKVRLVLAPTRRLAFSLPWLIRYLRTSRPDVFFSTEAAPNALAVVARRLSRVETRLVLREGLFPSIAVHSSPYLATRVAYRLAPYLYRDADQVVAIAEDMAEDVTSFLRVPHRKVQTIAVNPVVTDDLLAAAARPAESGFMSPEVPTVLAVGRLEKQKGFDVLIRAFRTVRNDLPCRLLILGEGRERPTLEQLVRDTNLENDVLLPGFVASPYPYMAACDVFVLSSRYEGLPNSLIEALACGAPVVATDCKSGPRDILLGGLIGPLVPVDDSEALALAVLEQLRSPPSRCRSRERGADFTIERSVDHYLSVLFPSTA